MSSEQKELKIPLPSKDLVMVFGDKHAVGIVNADTGMSFEFFCQVYIRPTIERLGFKFLPK
jgi:hypothetical protein